MDFSYQQHLPEGFDPNSRVWIYQANRLFTISEAFEIEDMLNTFLAGWNAHGVPVKGWANLLFGRFLIFMADEKQTTVSGCSTDSSVRLVKDIEQRFRVDMFDRQYLAFIIKEKIEMLPLSQLKYAMDNGFIGPDTLYFNNVVKNRGELEQSWIVPVKNSWLKSKLPSTAAQ